MLSKIPSNASLLNLHRYLPKDVRKLIYAKLDKYDIKLILKAHGSKEPILIVELSLHCVKNGHLELLKWARNKKCPWSVRACKLAAKNGHLEVLKYLHDNNCPWNANACRHAAENGHLEVLKYLHDNNCPRGAYTCVCV